MQNTRPLWHKLTQLLGSEDYRESTKYGQLIIDHDICAFRFDAPLIFTNAERFRRVIENIIDKWQKIPKASDNDSVLPILVNGKVDDAGSNVTNGNIRSINDNTTVNISIIIHSLILIFLQLTVKCIQPQMRYLIVDCSGIAYVDYVGINTLTDVSFAIHLIIYSLDRSSRMFNKLVFAYHSHRHQVHSSSLFINSLFLYNFSSTIRLLSCQRILSNNIER